MTKCDVEQHDKAVMMRHNGESLYELNKQFPNKMHLNIYRIEIIPDCINFLIFDATSGFCR